MGAKSKLTPEVLETLCDCVGLGMTYEQSADVAGIDERTLRRWRESNPSVMSAMKKAELDGMRRRLRRIERAANDGNWQADMTWLERRYPDQWGKRERQQIEHSGPHGQPITIRHFDANSVLADATAGSGDDREDAL